MHPFPPRRPPAERPPTGRAANPSAKQGVREQEVEREAGPARKAAKLLGPGLITGASDADPTSIGSYAQAGASMGYGLLWTPIVAYPLMASVQYLCAKIGMQCGKGLGAVLRDHYPRWIVYFALAMLLVSNTVTAGVDVGAIAAGVNLVVPLPPAWLIVPIAVGLVAFQVLGSYKTIEKTFKWLALALFTYVAAAFFAKPDWGAVLRGTFVPAISFDAKFFTTVAAVLGTTISPYMFFWQSSQEVEEKKAHGEHDGEERAGTTEREMVFAAADVNAGMLTYNVVTYFILLTTAAMLFTHGKHDIQSASDAAQALMPIAGPAAKYLFAIGMIGGGCLSVPVITGSSAYGVCQALGWKDGLDRKPAEAKGFYATIALTTALGIAINYVGINPMKALFWSSVLNGFLTPPLLVLIMLVTNNRTIMGDKVNGRTSNVLGWAATALMTAIAIGLVLTWGKGG